LSVCANLLARVSIVGLVSLTMLIAGFLAAKGTLRFVSAVQNLSHSNGWGWVAARGVITFMFAAIIASQLPTAALVLIGVLTGINLLMSWFSQIAYGFAARRLSSMVE